MFSPAMISFALFKGGIIVGIVGTIVLTLVITAYTIYEVRRRTIW